MHILFWMLLIFPFLPGPAHPSYFAQVKYRIIFNNSFLIVLFYFNAYYLFPKVYKKKGLTAYLLSATVAVALLVYVSGWLENRFMPIDEFSHFQPPPGERDFPPPSHPHHRYGRFNPPGGRRGMIPLPLFIFIIGISFSYRLMTDQNIEEKKRKEQETETLKTELGFLRSQISPHFMFNVLNTLVAMARKKSDLMEPTLIQLSTLMRYVLYESNHNRIALIKEVDYLKTYIELQSLRFGDDLNLVMEITDQAEGYEIEPMLLIPFVENAFKHGLGGSGDSRLYIYLRIDPLSQLLHFRVENEIAPVSNSKDFNSGIGLKNVSRRLELLYKNKHTLNTMIEDNIFIADLQIELR